MKKNRAIVLIIILLFVASYFAPVKFAIKQEDLRDTESYIIVQVQHSTAVSIWVAVGDNNGKYNEPVSINLLGDEPQLYSYEIEFGGNQFVCYGNYLDEGDFHGEVYKNFEITGWDILYPIKRDSLFNFILPNSYICRYDT